MRSTSKVQIFCFTLCFGLTIARSSQKIGVHPNGQVEKNPIVLKHEDESKEGIVTKKFYPTFLLPTDIINPSDSHVQPANLLPLDMQSLLVHPLDESKLEESKQNSKLVVQSSDQKNTGRGINKNSSTEPLVESELTANPTVQRLSSRMEEEMESTVKSSSDITLELNPNASDLEFLHANSTYKGFTPIPHFNAQILTLSYGGVKNPVLIVQPEMSKNSDIEGGERDPSSPMEETAIPTFSIHFPLETNSQFQIPKYNFTLPTLFLPGLVFTQNENVKTNTHEVHVSFPHSYDKSRPFPPALGQTDFELLPMNPKDSVGQQTSNPPQQSQSGEEEDEGKLESNPNHTITNKLLNNQNGEMTEEEEKIQPGKNHKSKGKPHPVVVTASGNNVTTNATATLTNSTVSNPISQPHLQVVNATSPAQHKWRLPNFGQIYHNFFGMARHLDCVKNNKDSLGEDEEEEEEDPTLCGSQGLCGVTCHRLGFYLGKCMDGMDDSSCVCLLKQRPDFGIQLDYYADKRDRSWADIYPVQGLCHLTSCRINCERQGYVTGFCDSTCLCGLPWAEKRVK